MVYFIQGAKTGLVKIGKTIQVVRRLRGLQVGSPDRLTVLKVILDAPKDRPIQDRFAASWSHDEWFNPTPDLIAFIESIPESEYDGLCMRGQRRQGLGYVAMAKSNWRDDQTSKQILRAAQSADYWAQPKLRKMIQDAVELPAPDPMTEMREELALNLVRDGELKVAEQVRAGKHEDMVAEYAYETDDDETADDRDS